MNLTKFKPLLRGVAAAAAALLTLSTVGYSIAKSDLAIGWVDGFFEVGDRTIYEQVEETIPGYTIPGTTEGYSYIFRGNYDTEYDTVTEYAEALREHIIRQGEEGFALLKNDNGALPLNKSAAGENVALFGWNAYNTPTGHTGVNANNGNPGRGQTESTDKYPKITLKDAFDAIDGVTVNDTVKSDHFTGAMAGPSRGGGWGGGASTPWEDYEYTIPEVAPEAAMVDSWSIDKASTTGIVVLGRGGGEGNNYKVDAATNAKDPLALSQDELDIVGLAKEYCDKVVVLIVSANAMELGPLVEEGGQYEVDAIGFCGIPNDYQYQGIANVLAGQVNATGGLTDTYVYDNSFTPASINMGQQQYSDLDTITNFDDPLDRGTTNYRAENYIVEAEGIYVGYKYYETRYFDSYADPDGTNATSTAGSTTGEAWDYANEVIFPFGQSLSYIPYSQEIIDVNVDLSENGNVTARVRINNEGEEDGYFLAQLYVNRPYTEYDVANNVEKSAVDFLSSKKVEVAAGESEMVEITVPTRYLASWDSNALNGEGTYILDEGEYIFTAAAGSHAAVNNFLDALNYETDETTEIGRVTTWTLEEFDDETFSVSNGVEVRNQMENADINYYLGEDTVTYLSRSDWEGTFPKNYTDYVNDSGIASEPKFTISGAEKEEEWLIELTSSQGVINESSNESEWADVEGTLPEEVQNGDYATVWAWILHIAQTDPEAFSDIHSEEWQAVADSIPLGVAIASVANGGHATKVFSDEIGNPGSVQSESVAGYSQTLKLNDEGTETMKLNVASNTLLGASFNPEFAYEWGLMEGEGGLWLQITESPSEYPSQAVTVWGAGLNQHRHAYNGRNSEYMSEDPMLTNRIGAEQLRGAVEKGSICGPKHMGFNDQELNRQGVACYMTEQKVRETDTRCYEGALRVNEGNGTGVMMSFARIGATNVTNSVGYIKNIMRGEWGFTGIVTTDMGMGAGYHELGALVLATVNEYASFSNNPFVMGDGVSDDAVVSSSWAYLTLGEARRDPAFAEQARQTALYVLFTIARSGSGVYVERVANTGEDIVVPDTVVTTEIPVGTLEHAGWEYIFITLEVVFAVVTAVAGIAWIASEVLPEKKEDN